MSEKKLALCAAREGKRIDGVVLHAHELTHDQCQRLSNRGYAGWFKLVDAANHPCPSERPAIEEARPAAEQAKPIEERTKIMPAHEKPEATPETNKDGKRNRETQLEQKAEFPLVPDAGDLEQ